MSARYENGSVSAHNSMMGDHKGDSSALNNRDIASCSKYQKLSCTSQLEPLAIKSNELVRYRKIADSEMSGYRLDDVNLYEFPSKTHQQSDIVSMIKNINIRRNAMTEQSSTRSYSNNGVSWFGSNERKNKLVKGKSMYIVKKRDEALKYRTIRDTALIARNNEKKSVFEFQPDNQEASEILTLSKNMDSRRNAVFEDK